ncbi:MAG: acylphosphatase [Kiritimatiellia bacterium]|nr:acylphosphatase [Lentisphaerota bacterium]
MGINLNNDRINIRVTGMVQGVGYRFACRDQARRLGLCGWVRNCADGSVEVVAEGPSLTLAGLADWCARGPGGAVVRDCRVAHIPAGTPLKFFEIHPTTE